MASASARGGYRLNVKNFKRNLLVGRCVSSTARSTVTLLEQIGALVTRRADRSRGHGRIVCREIPKTDVSEDSADAGELGSRRGSMVYGHVFSAEVNYGFIGCVEAMGVTVERAFEIDG